jgi:hypothetical protein
MAEFSETAGSEPPAAPETASPTELPASNIEPIQAGTDSNLTNNNNNNLDATPNEDVSTVGSPEPEADEGGTAIANNCESGERVPANPVVGGVSEGFTPVGGEKDVFCAALDDVETTEDEASPQSICAAKDDDPSVEPRAASATESSETTAAITWDISVCDHEGVAEVIMDVGTVREVDGGGIAPPVGDLSASMLSAGEGTSLVGVVVATDPATEGTVEPTTACLSPAPTEAKSNGSPLKIPFRTPKFGEQKQKKQHPSPSQPTTSLVFALPVDSLHGIASFLSPVEWTYFGQCSKGTNKIINEIFRRVRMHGFRCATEVVTAWVSAERHEKAPRLVTCSWVWPGLVCRLILCA